MRLVLSALAVGAFAMSANAVVLWDQYDTDGVNGLSMADAGAFGYQRALLDDFQVTGGDWTITDFHCFMLWNTMQPGSGWDFYLEFRPDVGGQPSSNPGAVTTGHVYIETATGRTWFSRPESEMKLQFDPITLSPGTYWFYGFVVGPENCFMMARSTITLSPCWLDYADYGGLQPGINVFGVDYDLAFQITGVPAPGALALLGLAGLARRRRR
jgi:hypothetical protein